MKICINILKCNLFLFIAKKHEAKESSSSESDSDSITEKPKKKKKAKKKYSIEKNSYFKIIVLIKT